MEATQEAVTSSPAAKPLPQEILYVSVAYSEGTGVIPFRKPITIDDAKAVAFDFASKAAEQTALEHIVIDASDDSGIKLHIFSGAEEAAHSYTLTAASNSPVEGAEAEIYLKAEPEAGQEILEGYRPDKQLEKLVKNARAYERRGGIVKKKLPASERMYQKGIALGQFAVVWTGFYAMKKAFPEQNAPLWLGFIWGIAWCYALLDGVYRIGDNVSVWQAKKFEEKTKKLEKKKKSLAAVSHERASED